MVCVCVVVAGVINLIEIESDATRHAPCVGVEMALVAGVGLLIIIVAVCIYLVNYTSLFRNVIEKVVTLTYLRVAPNQISAPIVLVGGLGANPLQLEDTHALTLALLQLNIHKTVGVLIKANIHAFSHHELVHTTHANM